MARGAIGPSEAHVGANTVEAYSQEIVKEAKLRQKKAEKALKEDAS